MTIFREQPVMEYLKGSKCTCGHLYDFYNEGKPSEKLFYPPDKHGPFWIDKAKVFQMDPIEDFIKETFKEGLKSAPSTVGTFSTKVLVMSVYLIYLLRIYKQFYPLDYSNVLSQCNPKNLCYLMTSLFSRIISEELHVFVTFCI